MAIKWCPTSSTEVKALTIIGLIKPVLLHHLPLIPGVEVSINEAVKFLSVFYFFADWSYFLGRLHGIDFDDSNSIFFPTALVTMICTRFFGSISKSAVLVAVFKAVRPSIIGMIASAAFTMMINNGITLFSVMIFAICLFLVTRVKFDPVYVIPAAGIAGLLLL